ncbi:MAG: hypothetical protein G01um1014106_686 [Parcubacteria group bacterium Gr01-1014_106]|nr:MAG: hypothetical protein G01um1014106_686 [Parcubacteria group bacterium Gr01-1014_106]
MSEERAERYPEMEEKDSSTGQVPQKKNDYVRVVHIESELRISAAVAEAVNRLRDGWPAIQLAFHARYSSDGTDLHNREERERMKAFKNIVEQYVGQLTVRSTNASNGGATEEFYFPYPTEGSCVLTIMRRTAPVQ